MKPDDVMRALINEGVPPQCAEVWARVGERVVRRSDVAVIHNYGSKLNDAD